VELRPLGDSGLTVSAVGLGCNNFGRRIDKERAREVVDTALDVGITHFDTAQIYGDGDSERFLGELLEGRRERVVLATKFAGRREHVEGMRIGSTEHVRTALDESLERLRTDYVDLLYLHNPKHIDTPIDETLGAMQELVEEGLARAIGCSNFSADQLREAEEAARANGRVHFSVLQNEYSLLEREAEQTTLPLAREYDVGFVPYFPLASGLLTGKYRRDEPAPEGARLAGRELPDHWDTIDTLESFAHERGRTLLELAIGGLASQPGVASVIAGATSPEQVRANAAAGEWRLSHEDLVALAQS
jgi:aryl-alcohol dehydrogenase-like predicted oxidoreductase